MTFREEVLTAARAAMARCKNAGTVAMSRGNLWMITRVRGLAADSPATPEAARAVFEAVCNETPALRRFTKI
jgi:hypothetical protein